jgi:hypothetical protein
MITEIQRLRRRAAVRPIPVLALALLITAGITYKVATKPKLYTADVVLAVNEGSLTRARDKAIPFDQLKEYVASVLLPDAEVQQVIEKHTPGRIDKVGAVCARAVRVVDSSCRSGRIRSSTTTRSMRTRRSPRASGSR